MPAHLDCLGRDARQAVGGKRGSNLAPLLRLVAIGRARIVRVKHEGGMLQANDDVLAGGVVGERGSDRPVCIEQRGVI